VFRMMDIGRRRSRFTLVGRRVRALLVATMLVGAGLSGTFSSVLSASRLAAPTVDAPTAAGVESQRAWLGGTVTADGGATITERGIVYSESTVNAVPVIGGSGVVKVVTRGTTGTFAALVQGLRSNTSYSYRPYATNADGTAYGPVATVRTTRDRPLRLWALGDDRDGASGLERKIRHWPFSPVAGQFVSVASGSGFSIAVRADGTVWSWGDNGYGGTAQGSTTMGTYTTRRRKSVASAACSRSPWGRGSSWPSRRTAPSGRGATTTTGNSAGRRR